jgi:hypothetical protein
MPVVARPLEPLFSDLVFHELDPSVGYARECINVTPPAASAPVQLGTVVFRATSLDQYAPYAVLVNASDIVATNDFAVVFGNQFGFNANFVPDVVQTTNFNAVAFKRGPVQLKDYYIKLRHANLTTAQFNTLKEQLKKHGVIIELTVA